MTAITDSTQSFARSDGAERFLDRFETHQRGAIYGIVVAAAHSGCRQEDDVLRHAVQVAQGRLGHAKGEHAAALIDFLEAVSTAPAEARAAASDAIRWAGLPPEVRAELSKARQDKHRREYLAARGPSEAQLRFLRSLGYSGPPPSDGAVASRLIQVMLDGGGACL